MKYSFVSLCNATIVLVTLAFVSIFLSMYTLNTYVVTESAVGTVRVYAWAPYLTAILSIGGIFYSTRKSGTQRLAWTVVGCVALLLFALSMRTLKFYAADGAMDENIPSYTISHTSLTGINEQHYCYRSSAINLELRPSTTGSTVRVFRGLWPSVFPDSSVKQAFMGAATPCPT
jgi:hypothetical protein